MTISVLICDDSGVARKQLAKALPDDWDVDISFATQGEEGLEVIRSGRGEVVFLDLNMPVLDGYGVLEKINQEHLSCMVIVVSGDIQPEARSRVLKAGAIAFIKKPVNGDELVRLLTDYGLYAPPAVMAQMAPAPRPIPEPGRKLTELDCYQEIANVAMGQAASLLARLLDVFVVLPIPKVNLLEISELQMALQLAQDKDTFSAVCQGFIGAGIAGEALLIFHDSNLADIAKLMKYQGRINETVELELIMDVASMLIGACTKGIAEQLGIAFSQGHPVVLGQHVLVGDLLKSNAWRWKQTLAIEISYAIEGYDIQCDLLLLFTEDSMDSLRQKVSYLLK